jgi:hypothetical protein
MDVLTDGGGYERDYRPVAAGRSMIRSAACLSDEFKNKVKKKIKINDPWIEEMRGGQDAEVGNYLIIPRRNNGEYSYTASDVYRIVP